jgi:arabinogalactan endo-1,4-beta-galactosidase
VPNSWKSDAYNTNALAQRVYDYTYDVLDELKQENLLPEMVQIGNETNGGMLLYESMNSNFDGQNYISGGWARQEKLFNAGIGAVRAMSDSAEIEIKIALHYAGVGRGLNDWYANAIANGITDFDVIGFSYYYAWHGSTIEAVGVQVSQLRDLYPDKEIIILETAYPWTRQNFDAGPNIVTAESPGYSPPTPPTQLEYLVDLTRTVKENGGNGVIFWESAWVSTSCRTPWIQGSGHDHVVFFDFPDDTFIPTGGGLFTLPEIYDEMNSVLSVFQADLTGVEGLIGVTLEADFDDLTDVENYTMYSLDSNIFTVVKYLPPGKSVNYNIIAHTENGTLAETIPVECNNSGARNTVIGDETTYTGYIWESCELVTEQKNTPTEVAVTFAVDMTGNNQSGVAYITGDFTSEGDWNILEMTSEGNNIYSYSQTIPVNSEGGWYFLNGNNWSDRETVPAECIGYYGVDRGFFIGEAEVTYAFKFGSCETFEYVQVSNEILNEIPIKPTLNQNYPNPFNPHTVISYELVEASFITITVFSITGQKVKTLVQGAMPAGNHSVTFNAEALPSGIYIYQLDANGLMESRKMLLLK